MKIVPVMLSISLIALFVFSLFAFVPASAVSVSPDHTAKIKTVTCPATAVVGTTVTCQASINRVAVTSAKFVFISPTGQRTHTIVSPLSSCAPGFVCFQAFFSPGQTGTWNVHVDFTASTGRTDRGVARTTVLAVPTPEFPAGAVLGVLAPIAALVGYVKFGRKPAAF